MDDAQIGSSSLPPFLTKTYEMVDDRSSDSIVSWSPSNKSFIVWKPPEFARILLPKFFKHNNFSSFIRQLNTYGFRKIDPEQWEFANDDFVRGQPQLLKNIHRRKPVHSHSVQNHLGQGSFSPLTESERQGLKEEVERIKHEKELLTLELERHEQECQGIEKLLKDRLCNLEKRQQTMVSFVDQVLHKPGLALSLVPHIETHDRKRRLPRIGHLFDAASLVPMKELFEQLESSLVCWEDYFKSIEIEEQIDMELQIRAKESEERVMLLSEELEHGSFLQDGMVDVPTLFQNIRNLTEEKMHLALEVSGLLQSQIVERASAKEELRLVKAEFESQTRRLEKEKNELQLALEKELDRRSSDWSFKLERYQQEEQRLRERVRELAEQNVSLQREVSSFSEREIESISMMKYSEKKLKDLTVRVEELSRENQALRQNHCELEVKYRAVAEDHDCMKRNFEEKAKECRELHKSIARLLRTCSDQEKTIDGLREGLIEECGKKQSPAVYDKYVSKLQSEHMRLTGVELALRREVESYRLEVDSLRHENINLLDRLKGNANGTAALTFKLDKEMWARICCLQSQGLSILNESSQLSSKLLEFIKGKSCQHEIKHGIEATKNGLDEQFIVESEIKVQGFKRGTENLQRSLQTMSALLHEKSNQVALKSQSHYSDFDGPGQLNDQTSEDVVKSELRAESLLTSLLREKLYTKELEVEQLQAELATAVRGNDILRFEVQNTMDNLSCVTHKLKDLELKMLKKDESISELQSNLQEYKKEFTIMRSMLPKVSQERDVMWEEVKQYSEKNMLLNSEINILKKKIEALDEDVLLKEGQITILKDTLGNTSFDLLGSPDNM